MIFDSELSSAEALAQNSESVAPDEVIQTLEVLDINYHGFDKEKHAGQLVIAKTLHYEVRKFFEKALELEFPIEKVVPAADPQYEWDDEKLMADNVSSGFNFRTIAGTDTPSKHARGHAFDINPVQNPYIRYEDGKEIVQPPKAVWKPEEPGTLHEEHPLVKLMEGFSWEWGGHWTKESGKIDYQHFQRKI